LHAEEAPSGALFKECKLPKESALRQMREFKDFKEANDPHNDHDFLGFVSKIDYHDLQMEFGSRPALWGSNASSTPSGRISGVAVAHLGTRKRGMSGVASSHRGDTQAFLAAGLFSCRISGRAFCRIWSRCSTLISFDHRSASSNHDFAVFLSSSACSRHNASIARYWAGPFTRPPTNGCAKVNALPNQPFQHWKQSPAPFIPGCCGPSKGDSRAV
jgi:hypothetical protein